MIRTKILPLLLLASCGTAVSVHEVDARHKLAFDRLNALNATVPSRKTVTVLREMDLNLTWRKDPFTALRQLRKDVHDFSPVARDAALIELLVLQAEGSWPKLQDQLYVSALIRAHDLIFRGTDQRHLHPDGDGGILVRGLYNASVAGLLKRHPQLCQSQRPLELRGWFGERIRVTPSTGENSWNPGSLKQFWLCREYTQNGLKNTHSGNGFGVALVGMRKKFEDPALEALHYPRFGMYQPATAIVHVGDADADGVRQSEFILYNTLESSQFSLDKSRAPLAWDTTLPLAFSIYKNPTGDTSTTGLFRPEEIELIEGIYLLEPYSPRKIPLLFVHGLWSSPLTWREAINDLRGDPWIRENFQFWAYLYPSGNPLLFNIASLRKRLRKTLDDVDRERFQEKGDGIVLIGHSMGSILSRAMIQESGDSVWNTFFKRSISQIEDLTEEERKLVMETFFFKPIEQIERVILCSGPFRGSVDSLAWYGRLGSKLISLPRQILRAEQKIKVRKGSYDQEDIERYPTLQNSIEGLEPGSPTLMALDKLGHKKGVPIHTIIGDRGKGDGEASSDGIVPYWSSHLETALSEAVVPSGHSVQFHPLGILEMRRILRLHLHELWKKKNLPGNPDAIRSPSLDDKGRAENKTNTENKTSP